MIFTTVAAVAVVIVVVFMGDTVRMDRQSEERLMRMTIAAQNEPPPVDKIFKDKSRSGIGALDRTLRKMPSLSKLEKIFVQANMRINVGVFILGSATLAAIGMLLCVAARQYILALPVGLILGILPHAILNSKRKRRMAAIEAQLPDALDLITRSLRAGHAFASGLRIVGDEMEEPIAGEFAHLADEQAFGVSLEKALFNLVDRVPLQDVRYFVTAAVLQRETGGNLTEVLESISNLIRERFKLKRQIKALSAEGRLSGLILTLLPPGLFGLLMVINPTYIAPLYSTGTGRTIMLIGGAMQLMGILMIRKLVNVKV